jgi:hypothetical protein
LFENPLISTSQASLNPFEFSQSVESVLARQSTIQLIDESIATQILRSPSIQSPLQSTADLSKSVIQFPPDERTAEQIEFDQDETNSNIESHNSGCTSDEEERKSVVLNRYQSPEYNLNPSALIATIPPVPPIPINFLQNHQKFTDLTIEPGLDPVSLAQFNEIIESVKIAIKEDAQPMRIGQGSSGSYFCRNTEGQILGVFKPKDEEPYGDQNPKWTKWIHRNVFFCCFGRSCLIPNVGSYQNEFCDFCACCSDVGEYIVYQVGLRLNISKD